MDLQNIKKYSHKYVLKRGDTFIIPPNWYYFQENNNDLNLKHYS